MKKKIVALAVVFSLAITAFGCGKKEKTEENKNNDNSQESVIGVEEGEDYTVGTMENVYGYTVPKYDGFFNLYVAWNDQNKEMGGKAHFNEDVISIVYEDGTEAPIFTYELFDEHVMTATDVNNPENKYLGIYASQDGYFDYRILGVVSPSLVGEYPCYMKEDGSTVNWSLYENGLLVQDYAKDSDGTEYNDVSYAYYCWGAADGYDLILYVLNGSVYFGYAVDENSDSNELILSNLGYATYAN